MNAKGEKILKSKFLFLSFSLYTPSLSCVSVSVCLCVPADEGQKMVSLNPPELNYKQWVLGIGLGFSGRVADALTNKPSLQPLHF